MDVAPRGEGEGAGVKKAWTNPICDHCWCMEEGERIPHRVFTGKPAKCCVCGCDTISGIWVRKDPETVPFPAYEDDE